MTSARSAEAWERVLAAIEADTARAAALLADDPHAAGLEPAELARIAVAAGQGYRPPAGLARTGPSHEAAATVSTAAAAATAPAGSAVSAVSALADESMTGPAPTGIPATWRLPAPQHTGDNPGPGRHPSGLPDPADMPPMPAELRDRIDRLRTRIAALQTDLAKALAEIRITPRPVRIPTEEARPGFVDRTV